ncbi:MAG: hypothetical protein HYX79_08170 [Chloroflexi bacterium]|nr:hypothetical protein [Chloroflexota bacterium]
METTQINMLAFWGSILGGAVAALLGFAATLMVEKERHKRQKTSITKALQREIEYNNSIIQKMIKEELKDDSGFGTRLTLLQTTSYLKALSSGVMAEFSASLYEEVSTVYQTILEIRRLINSGFKTHGRVSPQDPDNKVFWAQWIDSKGSGQYIIGIEQLPERLSKLTAHFQ